MHIAEPLIPEPPSFKVEITIEKLKNESQGTDQIMAELIQVGDNILCADIHKLINSIWNEEELSQQQKESFTVPMYKKNDKTDL
jgi:hypothetical protein